MLDIQKIRADFPILSQKVNGKPLVYFDNGATSQKPKVVIDAITNYYEEINANIHRGVHTLSQLATDAYEVSRGKIQNHINAKFSHEVIFTSGTTHSINAVANGFASILKMGDEVLVSAFEHHSNIVPWQLAGWQIDVCPLTAEGRIDLDAAEAMLTTDFDMVALAHVSNVLGSVLDAPRAAALARKVGACLLLDGCQAVPRLPVDVAALDCDFYVFSAHKLYGLCGGARGCSMPCRHGRAAAR